METTAEVRSAIPFAEHGGETLALDIAIPEAARFPSPRPAVLVLHGGAWRRGSRESKSGVIAGFAEEGYVAVAASYRFAPDAIFPAQIHDVKAAVRWMRSEGAAYGIDPERIAVLGTSAGGHLAAMLGVTGAEDGLEGTETGAVSSAVQAVIDYYGPSDLTVGELSSPSVAIFLGGPREAMPEQYAAASPVHYLSDQRRFPPFLIFHGGVDSVVPVDQSTRFAAALAEAGGAVELHVYPEEGHGFSPEKQAEAQAHVLRFLRTVFP